MMEVAPPPRPRTLPRKHYEMSQVYAKVVASRFSMRRKCAVSIANWQIRVVKITFVHTRGVDHRLRVYFPITSRKRIIVSLSKSAREEELEELARRAAEAAARGDARGLEEALHDLVDYCMRHSPRLYVEYSTKGGYLVREPKTLRILPRPG